MNDESVAAAVVTSAEAGWERDTPLVGVVIPVYNGAPYLEECLESLIAQTHRNWRCIVVDNASTDETPYITRAVALEDERVELAEDLEHIPMIPNWNRAMRMLPAGAKYCKVVHADDTLFPQCLDEMVALAEARSDLGLIGAYRLSGERVDLDGLDHRDNVRDGRAICAESLVGGPYVFGTPSSTMIRADIVRERDPFYDEANLHADTDVCFGLLEDSDFGFVPQVLSYTRHHPAANTSSFVNRVNTWTPAYIQTLARYGPRYLDRRTYRRRLRKMLGKYACFLVKQAAKGRISRDAELRDFHQSVIRDIDGRLKSSAPESRALVGLCRRIVTA